MTTSLASNPKTTVHRNEAGFVLGSHGNQQLSNTVETERNENIHATNNDKFNHRQTLTICVV